MRVLSFIFIFLFFSMTAQADQDCSLLNNPGMTCFQKRSEPVLNIALVHYGSFMKFSDLVRVGDLLVKRFEISTQSMLKLNILDYKILPLRVSSVDPSQIKRLPKGSEDKRDPARLLRLWYYENVNYSVVNEVSQDFIAQEDPRILAQLDSIVVASEAQFDGIGFQSGRVAITEQPTEIAWALADGGTTRIETDERLVDEFMHEIGHVLGLEHASEPCNGKPDEVISYQEMQECCKKSPNAGDVMSYCRRRDAVGKTFFYPYLSCNQQFLKDQVIPALLMGGVAVKQKPVCL